MVLGIPGGPEQRSTSRRLPYVAATTFDSSRSLRAAAAIVTKAWTNS